MVKFKVIAMNDLPLISFKLYYEDLPEHLVATFKAFTPEAQEKLRAMIKATEDQASLMLRAKQGKSVIFKLDQNYRLNTDKELVIFELPAGKVLAPLTDELAELIANANGCVYIKAKLNGLAPSRRGVIAKTAKLQFFRADYDLKTAEELLKEYKAIDLLMYGLGYKPTPEAIAVTLPRLLTLFKYYDRNKIAGVHVVSFQQAGTGKSSTFEKLESLANACYCEEIPTVARLIGDARLGTYGIVKRADIIAVDEFDKIAGDFKERFEAIFPILLTGMEQGIYRREVSSKRELSVKKAVSYCFMGNSNNRDLAGYGIAEKLTAIRILENILKDSLRNANISAFMDRLIYVEFLRESYQILKDINIDDNGLTLILQPTVARGVIKLLRERFLREFKLGEVENRTERAIKVLTAILKLLGLDSLAEDQGKVESLVKGELTFWDCLVAKDSSDSSNNSKPAEKPTDIKDKPKEPADKEDWINELQANLDSIIDEAYEKAENISFDLSYATGIEANSMDLVNDKQAESDNSKATAEATSSEYFLSSNDLIAEIEVEFTADCPKFVGIDGETYGPYKAKDKARLPALNARALLRAEVAKIVRVIKLKDVMKKELRAGKTVHQAISYVAERYGYDSWELDLAKEIAEKAHRELYGYANAKELIELTV